MRSVRLRRRDAVDEALARQAHEQRQAEFAQLGKPRDHRDALLRGLAEADAGIEHDALARDAGARRDVERAREERLHVGHDVERRIDGLAVVHHDHRHAVLGGDACHVGIALQAPDVVEDRGAPFERPGRDLGLDGVDRDRQAEPHDLGKHRRKTRELVVERDRLRAGIWPGRFRADVEDVGAFAGHAARMRDRNRRIEELSAVGEGIRRDIEDAHHQRPPAREQRCERIGPVEGLPAIIAPLCGAAGAKSSVQYLIF